MPRSEFPEYEQRRAESHEFEWRLAASLVNISGRICRFRQCRRHQYCGGPMLPSDHQHWQVRAQQEIGLSGKACASLPMCMAQSTQDHHAHLRGVIAKLTELRGRHPDWDLWWLVRREMRRQHRASST